MSLKDGDPSAAANHHRKVETFSPSVLDLSMNLLKGLTLISGEKQANFTETSTPLDLSLHFLEGLPSSCGNRSLTESRNTVYFT